MAMTWTWTCCFDLRLWLRAKRKMDVTGKTVEWHGFETQMRKRIRRLSGVLKVDPACCEQEFVQVALFFLEDKDGMTQVKREQDNHLMWARVLGKGKPVPCAASLETLPALVCWYLSILDGECGVERDLASLRLLLQEHEGSLDEDGRCAADLLELHLDGPKTEAEVALRASVESLEESKATLLLTDFSRRRCEVWTRLYGKRFRSYKKRVDAGVKRKPEAGTFQSLQVRQKMAVAFLDGRGSATSATETSTPTVLGYTRESLLKAPRGEKPTNVKLAKFRAHTSSKVAQQSLLLGCHKKVPRRVADVFANVFAKAKPHDDSLRIRHTWMIYDHTGRVVDASRNLPGKLVLPRTGADETSFQTVAKCEVILVESLQVMEQCRGEPLVCLF